MLELDVRILPRGRKHPAIFQILDSLEIGEALRIINDHDPLPLRTQLNHDRPSEFSWEYCDSSPELWVVEVARKQAKRS